MAARLATFPAAIIAVVIVVLQAFWICPHYFDRSTFEFRVFSLSSMDSSATTNASCIASSTFPILDHYTNYVNVHLSIDKLDGKNYDTWASDIRLWLKSQGYVDHLTTSVANVPENEVSRW